MKFFPVEKIFSFFVRLSPREKIIFLGAVFMVGLVISDRLIIRPILGTFSSLEREMDNLQTDIRKSIRLLSQKERILKEVELYAGYSTLARSAEEGEVALLKHIEELANKVAVTLLYVKPAAGRGEETEKKYAATLECETRMEQLMRFFYELESSSQLLKIEKYAIQPTAKESVVVKSAITVSQPVLR